MKRSPIKKGVKQMKRSGFRRATSPKVEKNDENELSIVYPPKNKTYPHRIKSGIAGEHKPKRKKRTPRQIIEDKLWEECKRIVRKRYQNPDGTWTCYTSGQRIDEPAKCQTGHGKPKGALPVRFKYDLRNLRPQCYHANINLGGMSDIFIAKLEREQEGLEFLNEACVFTDGRWEIKQGNTMGSMEAFEFLTDLYTKYKAL